MRLFHGGAPGLRAGDRITAGAPHYVDGCEICEAHKAGAELVVDGAVIDPASHEPERVFVTTDREYARYYASKYPRGDLYTVDVEGELVPSPEDPFPAWHVEAAIVRGTLDRYVQLTGSQRARLMARWTESDREKARARRLAPAPAGGPPAADPEVGRPPHGDL